MIFTDAPAVYQERLREFLRFLKANPNVASFIQRMQLTFDYTRRMKQMVHLDLELVLEMLSQLINLDGITINEVCFAPPTAALANGLPQCLTRILFLRDIFHHDDDRYHLRGFIANCPRVQHIHAIDCRIGLEKPLPYTNNPWEFVLPPSLQLHCLELIETLAPPFLHGLMKTETVTAQTLAFLKLDLPHKKRAGCDMKYLRPLTHAVGPELLAFELRYETSDEEYYGKGEGEYIKLSNLLYFWLRRLTMTDDLEDDCDDLITQCTKLEELTLHPHFGLARMPALPWTQTASLLSQIVSTKLSKLVIVVSSRSEAANGSEQFVQNWEKHVQWASIQESLSKFKSLQLLRFVGEAQEPVGMWFIQHELAEDVQAYIKGKLKMCLPSGVSLVFDIDPDDA